MKIVKLDREKWIISLDEALTRAYAFDVTQNPTYAYSKYRAFCSELSSAEYNFFEQLCLNAENCRLVSAPGFETEDSLPVGGTYVVCGRLLRFPEEDVITADELKARNFQYEFKDKRIYVGRFIFDIQCPSYLINTIPPDWPEEYIRINFYCNIPKGNA